MLYTADIYFLILCGEFPMLLPSPAGTKRHIGGHEDNPPYAGAQAAPTDHHTAVSHNMRLFCFCRGRKTAKNGKLIFFFFFFSLFFFKHHLSSVAGVGFAHAVHSLSLLCC